MTFELERATELRRESAHQCQAQAAGGMNEICAHAGIRNSQDQLVLGRAVQPDRDLSCGLIRKCMFVRVGNRLVREQRDCNRILERQRYRSAVTSRLTP